jgi:N6-L-threonylcarbamoyladenine synthase
MFPRFHQGKANLEFSFSGLKTALLYKLREMPAAVQAGQAADLAAGYQEAIVQVLVTKAFAALAQTGLSALAVVGGVSANSRLRTLLMERAHREGVRLSLPPMTYCTDNAAMIAAAGRQALLAGLQSRRDFDIEPALSIGAAPHRPDRKESRHS